jgi:hypothetical protein
VSISVHYAKGHRSFAGILPGLRRGLSLAALAAVLAGTGAGVGGTATSRYEVVAATATAQITFSGGSSASQASGTATLKATRSGARGGGSLGDRGGSVRFGVRAASSERVKLREREGPTSPYVEQECRDSATRSASGGLTLQRLPGGRIRVAWAFPHAALKSCPGPRSVGSKLQGKMSRIFPASRFAAARLTLTLAGSASFSRAPYRGVYRWRASVRLLRR